jgi:hypothetical protein
MVNHVFVTNHSPTSVTGWVRIRSAIRFFSVMTLTGNGGDIPLTS